jgi:hypothetical protein
MGKYMNFSQLYYPIFNFKGLFKGVNQVNLNVIEVR